jgi:hypothetical protein
MLALENDRSLLVMIGSSNFTRAGFGLDASAANIEANLVYVARSGDAEFKALGSIWPCCEDDPVDLQNADIIWDPIFDETKAGGDADLPPLPKGFVEAVFWAGKEARLVISLSESLPTQWEIKDQEGGTLLASTTWSGSGDFQISWNRKTPFVLQVVWTSEAGSFAAHWPVNVAEPAELPPPSELANLTLDELIAVLGSTRPLHEAVLNVLRKAGHEENKQDIELNPLHRINPETLLKRTRRVSLALDRLRERLERPALTLDALDWRLRGPVGPMALAAAFQRESLYAAETRFYLAELALALKRVRVERAAGATLATDEVGGRLMACIWEVETAATSLEVRASSSPLDRYIQQAFAQARQ